MATKSTKKHEKATFKRFPADFSCFFVLEVALPANTTGTVHVPAA